MRAYVILSNVPDIVFFSADEEYRAQLREKTRHECHPDDPSAMSGDINMDTLQMQFLPIFAATEMMKLVDSPIKSMRTSDGFTCVIRTFDDYVYIGMGNANSETFIEGQLILLRDLISMLYGPVIANLKPSQPALRAQRWKSTASILTTMEEQRRSDQCYLVQAIEIIRVNGFVRRIFADVLESALQKAVRQTGQGTWGSHAMLLVGTKLLALYSHPSTPELNTSDLFLLGLFIQDVFKRELPDLHGESPLADKFRTPATQQRPQRESNLLSPPSGDRFYNAVETLPDVATDDASPAAVTPMPAPIAAAVADRPRAESSDDATFESPAGSLTTSPLSSPRISADLDAVQLPSFDGLAIVPQYPDEAPGLTTETNSVSERRSALFHDANRVYDPSCDPASGSSHTGSSYDADASHTGNDDPEALHVASVASTLGELRREPIFLHMPSNNFAPYILHCVEVEQHIKLVVLSEGRETPTSELMHLALRSLNRILELGYEFQQRQRMKTVAEEIPRRTHMAVRGAMGQASAHAQINGNYRPVPGETNGDRCAYERTTKDLFLFYSDTVNAWCIGAELHESSGPDAGLLLDTSRLLAMVSDSADAPDGIVAPWEVFDHDMNEFKTDTGLQIRCVRGDGAIRNREGRWATQSTNSHFYCLGPAACLCGGCNGFCGPKDGCNCASCKLLDGSDSYGASELALMVKQEREQSRLSMAESVKTLKLETESAAAILKRLVMQVGGHLLSQNARDLIVRLMNRLSELVSKKDVIARWSTVIETTEQLSRAIRVRVGETIARSNQNGNEQEVKRMKIIEAEVKNVLKDYYDFLHVKIHRNVTMTAYLDMFPGLVHFIYVDRTSNIMVAPCLTSTSGTSDTLAAGSLKLKVWEMHAHAMEYLKQGYTTMAMKAGDFRYTYFLWFENADRQRIEPDKEIGRTTESWSTAFYHDLVARLFPKQKGIVKCYELYLIHLGLVPFDHAVKMGHGLVEELRESNL